MICEQLLGLLYGSIVGEVVTNSEHIPEANDRLQKIGFRIGTKIVDEFMRDYVGQTCTNLQELASKFCTVKNLQLKVGMRKFLNPYDCKCEQFKYRGSACEFRIRVIANPLLSFVEIPVDLKNANLQYQSITKGAIRGAFEVLQFKANITIIYENLSEKNETIFYVELAKLVENKEQ